MWLVRPRFARHFHTRVARTPGMPIVLRPRIRSRHEWSTNFKIRGSCVRQNAGSPHSGNPVNAKAWGCGMRPGEGEAPAEPRARGHVDSRQRLGRSLALPREAYPPI